MGKSVLRDAQDPAAQNRRIAIALLASVLLHAWLFIPSGAWRLGTLIGTAQAPVTVRIEPPVEAEKEAGTALEEPAEVEPAEPQLPEPEALPPSEPVTAEAPAVADAPAHAETAAAETVVADAETESIPESSLPSSPELPADPELPVSVEPPVVATVSPSHEVVLARRLEREARMLLEGRALQGSVSFEHDDQEFTAVLTRRPAVDGMDIEHVQVEVTSERGGQRMQTTLRMKRLTFSHFTQLVDRWDPWVVLHDDEIAGRFHSNTEILLTYDRKVAPRLLGKVTAVRGVRFSDTEGWQPRRKIFVGGVATRAPRVRLPAIALPVAQERETRNADVHVVRSDARIVFHPDGTYDRTDLGSNATTRERLAPGKPTYFVGTSEVELRVRGIVDGCVTVYSPERIVIEGSLTYAGNPRAGGDDALGLVSDGNVEIAPQEITGPGDLDIHAAIYARDRFVVRGTRARGTAMLSIFGSLTAGSVSETEPRYATRLEFDPRFERIRPPGFPETDRYEIEAWDGSWRLAEAPSDRSRNSAATTDP